MKPSIKYFGILIITTCLLMGTTIGVVGEKEYLPDLIITQLDSSKLTGDLPHIFCRVVNIGDFQVNQEVHYRTSVKKLFMGIFPMEKEWIFTKTDVNQNPIEPDDWDIAIVMSFNDIPGFGGFFRYYCEVNYDKSIVEWDYSNNYYNATFFHIGGAFPLLINTALDIFDN